jgi:hypothetical protein
LYIWTARWRRYDCRRQHLFKEVTHSGLCHYWPLPSVCVY